MSMFEQAVSQIEKDIDALQQLPIGISTLVPIAGQLGFVHGRIMEVTTIRLSDDIFVKITSRREAIEILERSMARLKLAWLEYLEKESDLAGLDTFEKRFNTKPAVETTYGLQDVREMIAIAKKFQAEDV